MSEHTSSVLTVHQLRQRWKPHKERLNAQQDGHPNPIRFHRACSWLARVEAIGDEVDPDGELLSQWIAFNALYGQWDAQAREPLPDRQCWRTFLDRILKLDREGHVVSCLKEHKRLVLSLLDDEYLSGYFWQEPSAERAGKSRKAKFNAQGWYIEQRWAMILDQLLERIYLLRCQLVHGAATYGGKLNRTSLRRCNLMLQKLLPAVLLVWTDQGADEDWGTMCYPPLAPLNRQEQAYRQSPKYPR